MSKNELDPYRSMYKWAHLLYLSINNWMFYPSSIKCNGGGVVVVDEI